MSKNEEDEPGVQYEYLGCYVTILNLSKYLLKNAQLSATWGKYTLDPATNIDGGKKASTTLVMQGRSGAWSGPAGAVSYEVGSLGNGTVDFSYSCPYSGDNYGLTKDNSADLVLLGVYGQIGKRQGIGGNEGWALDESNWGREGNVPISGYPLALLFVVRDLG